MRRSLAGIAFAVTALVAVAFLVPLGVLIGGTVRERVVAEAFRAATAVGPVLLVSTEPDDVRRVLASTREGAAGRMTVYLPRSRSTSTGPASAVATTGAGVIGTPHAPAVEVLRAARTGRSFTTAAPGGLAVLQPVLLDGGRTAVVEVLVPDADLSRGVLRARLVLLALALVLVAGSVAVADRLAARVVRSARGLSQAAARLGAGDLEVRLDPQGPPELRESALAFNAMAMRISALLTSERELAADLSHRLRTPLTALLLACRSLSGEPAGEQIRAAAGQLEAEIDGIIRRVGQTQAARPVSSGDAGQVLRARLDFWGVLAEDEQRSWSLDVPDRPVPVPVRTEDLAAAVDALLGNVFVHTRAGRPFAVRLVRDEESVEITVDDAGAGIADPAGALRRGSSGAGSTGLGLDIARRLAEGTGGGLRIGSSPWGGARVEMLLRTASERPSRWRRSRRGTLAAG